MRFNTSGLGGPRPRQTKPYVPPPQRPTPRLRTWRYTSTGEWATRPVGRPDKPDTEGQAD